MVSINLDLSEELQAQASRAAASRGVSLEDFVRECLTERLARVVNDPFLNDTAVFSETSEVSEADEEHIDYMRRGLEKAEQEIADGLGKPWDPDGIRRLGFEKLERSRVRNE